MSIAINVTEVEVSYNPLICTDVKVKGSTSHFYLSTVSKFTLSATLPPTVSK